MVRKVHNSFAKLDKIALKKNPFTEVEYLQLQIESEKSKEEPGFMEWVKFHKEPTKDVEIIQKFSKEQPYCNYNNYYYIILYIASTPMLSMYIVSSN